MARLHPPARISTLDNIPTRHSTLPGFRLPAPPAPPRKASDPAEKTSKPTAKRAVNTPVPSHTEDGRAGGSS
jgi:hypothetical protein